MSVAEQAERASDLGYPYTPGEETVVSSPTYLPDFIRTIPKYSMSLGDIAVGTFINREDHQKSLSAARQAAEGYMVSKGDTRSAKRARTEYGKAFCHNFEKAYGVTEMAKANDTTPEIIKGSRDYIATKNALLKGSQQPSNYIDDLD